jgi:hypothetical protein
MIMIKRESYDNSLPFPFQSLKLAYRSSALQTIVARMTAEMHNTVERRYGSMQKQYTLALLR